MSISLLWVAVVLPKLLLGTALQVDVELVSRLKPVGSRPAMVCAAPRTPSSADSTSQPPPTICIELDLPGSASLIVRPDLSYRLSVSGDGIWSPDVSLPVGSGMLQAHLKASGAGTVRAKLVNDTGHPLEAWPTHVAVRVQLLESPLEIPASEQFEIVCPVEEDDKGERRFSCTLPEGTLDVRLEAEGFVPRYLWSLQVQPKDDSDIGDLELRRGASLVGTVLREDGAPAVGAEVMLEPSVGEGTARARLRSRLGALTYRAEAQARGFFQVSGLPEATFDLVATLEGYGRTERTHLTFSEPVEHRLDEAIEIPWFPEAVVVVDPATAPGGGNWTVRLFRPDGMLRLASSDRSGEASFDLIRAGDYVVMVEDADGQRWLSRTARIDAAHARLEVAIDEVAVIGTVSLGDEPIAATLYFGGRSGSESISMSSGADGEFTGILPRDGPWLLEIHAEDPPVRHAIPDLPVEVDPGLGAAELSIDLADTTVEGRVLDSRGEGVAGAQVLLQADGGTGRTVQVQAGVDGTFTFRGEGFGDYRLQAFGPGRAASPVEEVLLEEHQPARSIELVLTEPSARRGRIVSRAGSPIAGATVWPVQALGAETGGDLVAVPSTTDVEGEFDLPVRAHVGGGRGVAILATGFVLTVAPVPDAPTPQPWVISLDQAGSGTLGLHFEEGRRGAGTLVLDGRWPLPLPLLTRWLQQNGGALSATRLEIPLLPAGRYEYCRSRTTATRSADCRSGVLSPGGNLDLELEENDR